MASRKYKHASGSSDLFDVLADWSETAPAGMAAGGTAVGGLIGSIVGTPGVGTAVGGAVGGGVGGLLGFGTKAVGDYYDNEMSKQEQAWLDKQQESFDDKQLRQQAELTKRQNLLTLLSNFIR